MNPTTPSCDVVTVGAGVAGLVAAHALSRSGHTVKCFEARDRVGGRVHSVEYAGLSIDLGATWFWHNEPLVRSTLDQLGLGSFPQRIDGDGLFESFEPRTQRLDSNPIDVPAMRFNTGAQSLATALADHLPCGVLNLDDPVLAITHDGQRVVVEATSGRLAAQHVIIALPPALAVEAITFSPELPDSLRQAASATSVWMGETVKAIATYDTPFWRANGLAGSAISFRGPFREFHDHSGPSTDGAGAIFGFAPAQAFPAASDADIANAFRIQLVRIFGQRATNPQEVLVTNWLNQRYTTPARPSPQASPAGFGHSLFQEPAGQGRIHWASTESDTAYAGHIEGAIRAGSQAARRIGARLTG